MRMTYDYPVRLVIVTRFVVVVDVTFPVGTPIGLPSFWHAAYTADCYKKDIPYGGASYTSADHPGAQRRIDEWLQGFHWASNCITGGDPIAVWPEGLPRPDSELETVH